MSTKSRLKRIQEHLNVRADGILGPATLTALENRLGLPIAPAASPAHSLPTIPRKGHSLTVSRESLGLIVQEEIGSYAYYALKLQRPYWPGGRSGVTIGIGYDLGAQTKAQIKSDWKGKISDRDLGLLLKVSGISGKSAKGAAKRISSVVVPLDVAKEVFFASLLPRYAKLTLKAFPEANDLYPDAQGALLSLVYNRGSSLKGSRRREMRAIRELVPEKDYSGIARQIESMKRLWGSKLSGLLKRRDKEAELVANSHRTYSSNELVRV